MVVKIMNISLKRATYENANLLKAMQRNVFAPYLTKYQDYKTNPALESMEKVYTRIDNGYYLIVLDDDNIIGASSISVNNEAYNRADFDILLYYICKKYQNQGYGTKAFALLYPIIQYKTVALRTVKQDEYLVHFYEKLGFKPTGDETFINDHLTLINMIRIQ